MEQQKKIRIKAIRYNFTPEMMSNIQEFTRIHRFDDRKKYKEEWKCWISTREIQLKVSSEIVRLKGEGCTWEDEVIKEKMYKSSKFYYKKKMETEDERQEEKSDEEEKRQEKYKGFTKQFLRRIDGYIIEKIKEKSKTVEATDLEIIPAKVYNEFCKSHQNKLPLGRIDDEYCAKEPSKRGRKRKNNVLSCNKYIVTHMEQLDGDNYLVDDNNFVYSFDVNNPEFLGVKENNTLKKIDVPLTEIATY